MSNTDAVPLFATSQKNGQKCNPLSGIKMRQTWNHWEDLKKWPRKWMKKVWASQTVYLKKNEWGLQVTHFSQKYF